ncbi:MAG TPA: sigma 54-interacting transcriptional regulator, partial [Terriglobales bacterium]|nr:sigma 54-interacting transcriptional regulator [Terriglobales bacterium]
IPRPVAQLALRAAETRMPILITGEPGTGKSRLARAIHAFQGGRFLMLPAEQLDGPSLRQALAGDRCNVTLYIGELAAAPSAARLALREVAETGGLDVAGSGPVAVRIIAASVRSLPELQENFAGDASLFHHLTVFPIELPPLRERLEDLPALVEHFAARMFGPRRSVQFTPAAMEQLRDYLWFGNVAELEAVLARTLLRSGSGIVDADDLAFGLHRPVERTSTPPPAVAPGTENENTSPRLDLVITELAHEFKNPMVVIKTASQHLERLLEDESARKEMMRLAGDAVDRMDRVLENLLQFTRFDPPAAQDLSLDEVLSECLGGLGGELAERKIAVDYQPAGGVVHADAMQIAYALDNLLRVAVRDLSPGAGLRIRVEPGGARLEFQPGAHGISRQLAQANGSLHSSPELSSLGFWLARVVVERNGGALHTALENDKVVVALELPQGSQAVES